MSEHNPVLIYVFALLCCAFLFSSCSSSKPDPDSGKIKITATTGMVADMAKYVGGKHVSVTGMMGPGVDPHLYKANEKDIRALASADIIFYNGLNLEGKLGTVLERMSEKKPTIAIADHIPKSQLSHQEGGHYDPHIWFDVSLWMKTIESVRSTLAKHDPAHENDYSQNAAMYRAELESLHEWCQEQIALIPKAQRILVTAHDAFGYFGRAYDIEVLAIQGISTESEASVRKINDLVTYIAENGIRAVFVESSVSQKNIEALVEGCKAKGHNIDIGGELYSDAMGPAGTPEGTYVGMVRSNVITIVKALK